MPLDDSTIAVLNELLAERDKLLQAHYAEAIPLDLLKTEQENEYPKGIKYTDEDIAKLNLESHDLHPKWNYTISPKND